ncbi:MAG TPA: hypothetical protein VJ761_24815 [Ktedonobacteraceae bacterium]|nr:hypothetical protein [Ktedonobacteraceae bacterium]
MSRSRTGIVLVILGAILGAVIGYSIVQSALASLLGALIGAVLVLVGIGLFMFVPGNVWLALAEFGQVAECCAYFGIVPLAIMITLGEFLLWHSFVLAALATVSVITVLLMMVSVGARLRPFAARNPHNCARSSLFLRR